MFKRIAWVSVLIVSALLVAIVVTAASRNVSVASGSIVTSIERRQPPYADVGPFQDAEGRLAAIVNTQDNAEYSVTLGSDRVVRVEAAGANEEQATVRANEGLAALKMRIETLESRVDSKQDRIYVLEVVPAIAEPRSPQGTILRVTLAMFGALLLGGALLLLLKRR